MHNDEQLGDALRLRLFDEVAEVHAEPGLAGVLQRRYRHRTRLTRAGLLAPLVAAAAIGATVLAGGGATVVANGGVSGRHAPPAGNLRDVAYVTAATSAALARVTDYVEYSDFRADGGFSAHTWIDMRTNRSRSDQFDDRNRPQSANAVSGPATGPQTLLVVDFAHRAWWTYQYTRPTMLPGGALKVGIFQDPTQIREALTKGKLRVVGEERVNGHDTLHLRLTDTPKGFPTSIDLWVDTQTFLIYRLKGDKAHMTSTVDYQWRPRTPENLAHLILTPPAGFTHLDQPLDPKTQADPARPAK